MKLKENKGMSLIVFIIILAVIVLVTIGVIMYLLNNPLKENVSIQNETGVQNNLVNNENTEKNNEIINNLNTGIYTNYDMGYIKIIVEEYYKLLEAKENSPILMLTDVMKLTVQSVQDSEHVPDNYMEHPNPSKYMWTGIKYEDFKNNLWYISDNVLKGNFAEFVEYKNYLYIEKNENNAYGFKYEIIKREINQNSNKDTCICDVTVKNSKTGKIFKSKVTMERGNDAFIIVSVFDN